MNKKRDHQNVLLSMIPKGRENAISMKSISQSFDVSDRDVRQGVMLLRLEGRIIAGDQNGYYIPSDRDELQEYVKYVSQRQKTTAKSLSAARRKLKELETQNE